MDNGSPAAAAQYPQLGQVNQMVVAHAQSGAHPLGPQPMGNDQVVGMHVQPITNNHLSAINSQVGQRQQLGLHSQPIQGGPYMGMPSQPMQAAQMASMYPQQMYGNQYAGYGYGQQGMQYGQQGMQYGQQQGMQYGQQQGMQYVDQRMYGLSVSDYNGLRNAYQVSNSSYVSPNKPSKPEDKLFGDLVDMAKVKPKPTPGRAGTM